MICLLAQLARGNLDTSYYSAGLRQLSRLLAAAPRESTMSQPMSPRQADPLQNASENRPISSPVSGTRVEDSRSTSDTGTNVAPTREIASANSRKKKKKIQQRTNMAKHQKLQPQQKSVNTKVDGITEDPPKPPVETLADLQALFRVKNGFSLLGKEIQVCNSVYSFLLHSV